VDLINSRAKDEKVVAFTKERNEMKENECCYADGVESLSVVDGVVRLELFLYKSGKKDEGRREPEHLPIGQIAMPLNGLVRLHDAVGRLIEDMTKRAAAAKETAGSQNFPEK
jgi:hypothetical protein